MKRLLSTGAVLLLLTLTAAAQDWYRDRAERYRGCRAFASRTAPGEASGRWRAGPRG